MRRRTPIQLLFPLLVVPACNSSSTSADAGDAATSDSSLPTDGAPPDVAAPVEAGVPADASPDAGACIDTRGISQVYPTHLYVAVGAVGSAQIRLGRDLACAADYTLVSDAPGVLTVPGTLHIDRTHADGVVSLTGVSPGIAHVHIAQVGTTVAATARDFTVEVRANDVPACPVATPVVTGTVSAGHTVSGAAGSPLEAASFAFPAMATAPSFAVTIACSPDQVPAGYDAIGPAISFAPARLKFNREMTVTVPINAARVANFYELSTEISYTAPGTHAPQIVAMANTHFTPDGKALEFLSPQTGTFQAVIRHNTGSNHVTKHLTYRAILGISMGALGGSMIATRHPELFDTVIPMGGPADWGFFGDYFRTYHVGGFCTAAQRAAMGDAACAHASSDRTPETGDLWTVKQNFEFFNYPDGRSGQGGTFDRHSYIQIFRDLASQFGNPLMQSDPVNQMVPVGIDPADQQLSDAVRCDAAHVRTLSHFYDDEYNPDGSLPVITFCDGNRTSAHAGEFAGGQGNFPFEIGLAVDVNRNGVRDFGEPVIRNLYEPYRDTGTDGLPSTAEPGYNAVTNPDPAGDDYDRQFNPGGTEGDYFREEGEPFDDVGLDGMACPGVTASNPISAACPYDTGEGNGHWDYARGIQNFYDRNPRSLYAALPQADAHRLGIWADGGTRDLFNFGSVANHFVSAVAQRGESLHVFDNYTALLTGVPISTQNDDPFQVTLVDWEHLPTHIMMRYGFEDASSAELIDGDGGHVGTGVQVINRLYAGIWSTQAHWPTRDRAIAPLDNPPDPDGHCTTGYQCSFDFHSDGAHRTGPVSVYLPPGYHDPANAGKTYPVVYFLHGYGQQPMDLLASGLIIGNYMGSPANPEWSRPGKFIMVFPDGRCRDGDGCIRGTFYTNSPSPQRAQMETYFLDLYHYIDTHYRARAPEDVQVVE